MFGRAVGTMALPKICRRAFISVGMPAWLHWYRFCRFISKLLALLSGECPRAAAGQTSDTAFENALEQRTNAAEEEEDPEGDDQVAENELEQNGSGNATSILGSNNKIDAVEQPPYADKSHKGANGIPHCHDVVIPLRIFCLGTEIYCPHQKKENQIERLKNRQAESPIPDRLATIFDSSFLNQKNSQHT